MIWSSSASLCNHGLTVLGQKNLWRISLQVGYINFQQWLRYLPYTWGLHYITLNADTLHFHQIAGTYIGLTKRQQLRIDQTSTFQIMTSADPSGPQVMIWTPSGLQEMWAIPFVWPVRLCFLVSLYVSYSTAQHKPLTTQWPLQHQNILHVPLGLQGQWSVMRHSNKSTL